MSFYRWKLMNDAELDDNINDLNNIQLDEVSFLLQ